MYTLLAQPLLLGVSIGLYCFTFCVPFIAPYMVAEKRGGKESLRSVLQFLLGRFVGYCLFGATFGYLGERINKSHINAILISALMIMSILTVIYALGILKPKGWFCWRPKKIKMPILLGFFMGVNICPPFLLSLTFVFTLHSIVKGVIYFVMFFLGTSIYFLPLTYLGFLSKYKEMRWVARIAAVLVGVSFFVYGLFYLYRGAFIFHNF